MSDDRIAEIKARWGAPGGAVPISLDETQALVNAVGWLLAERESWKILAHSTNGRLTARDAETARLREVLKDASETIEAMRQQQAEDQRGEEAYCRAWDNLNGRKSGLSMALCEIERRLTGHVSDQTEKALPAIRAALSGEPDE